MIAMPRPAYRALRAFADTVKADAQVVFVKALQDHIDQYSAQHGEEFVEEFRSRLAKLEKEEGV